MSLTQYPVIRVGRKFMRSSQTWRVRLYINGKPQRDVHYKCGRKATDAALEMVWNRGAANAFAQENASCTLT